MKQSELLRKQADMLDMAEKYGLDDWRKLVQFRNAESEEWKVKQEYEFFDDTYYRFALGVVEGRPVFEGDALWREDGSGPVPAALYMEFPGFWTWTPPKPETVTVELLREDAEWLASFSGDTRGHATSSGKACRKALEEQK